jgi:hypothetical protein
MLTHSLVLSYLDYCAPVLYGTSKDSLGKLQMVMNAALKSLKGLRKFDHISTHYKEAEWLTIEEKVKYRTACLIYSVVTHNNPIYLRQLLLEYQPVRDLRSGDQKLLTLVRANSVAGSRAFRVYAPTIWNSLPLAVREAPSSSAFHTSLKKHLLEVRENLCV